MKQIKTVDLFSGCGGLSLGFQQAGFDIVAAFENWDAAIKCYKANFSHPVFKRDLSNVEDSASFIKGFEPDLIIGGPPCQDFSSAGKREEKERANLTVCFAQIISKIKPNAFVMENVSRAKESKAFNNAEKIYKEAGYGLTKIVLNAALCGVPQKRKRFFCIGILNGKDNQLLESITKDLSHSEMTLRQFFGNSLGFEFYYRHPRNYNRRAVFSIDEPAPTMRGVNRPIPKGYPGHKDDACPIGPSVHALTTRDRALIQTFPADFVFNGTKTENEQMVGNAVPVVLARFVANHVLKVFDPFTYEQMENAFDNFVEWLKKNSNIKERSANDVVSRIKRVTKISGPILSSNSKDECYKFGKNAEKLGVNSYVESQMKRAIKLYCEWLAKAEKPSFLCK